MASDPISALYSSNSGFAEQLNSKFLAVGLILFVGALPIALVVYSVCSMNNLTLVRQHM